MRASISAGFLVALTLAAAPPARAGGDAACLHALAKASDKYFVAALKSAQRCIARQPGVCRFTADSTGYAPTDAALGHADARLLRGLQACGDRVVAGMGFDATCGDAVPGRAALGQCIERTHRAAVQALVSVQFPQGTGTCGDGVVDAVEDCDPVAVPTGCATGQTCGAAGSADECTCVASSQCGDGTVQASEQCDPAATPSGCGAGFTCIAAGQPGACICSDGSGNSCSGQCTPTCAAGKACICSCSSICGNGTVETGEQCDPMANPSGCAAGLICGAPGTANQCTCFSGTATCGNGQLEPGEGCDPALPNTCDPGEVCLADGAMACTCGAPPANCGNGLVEWGEQCDPAASPTGCSGTQLCGARGTPQACTCTGGGNPMCGNGTVDPGEACDPAATPTGCAAGQTCDPTACTCSSGTPTCGNGTIDPGEACDPTANPTGCPAGSTCNAACTCGGGDNCAISPTPTKVTFTTAVGSGTCGQALQGATSLMPCTPLGSANTSPDCPPGDQSLADLAVDLSPLTTGAASKTGPSFCPSHTHAGAFGKQHADKITENGAPAAGGITVGTPATIRLGSTFCIPKTGNGALDPTADLPGPGAISLPGTLTIR